jgi:hypothetical protein
MSSTKGNSSIARIFEREIIPAAKALRARSGRFFELGPSPADASYFKVRTLVSLAAGDFHRPVVGSREEFRERLLELWADQPELGGLVNALVEVAAPPDPSDEGDASIPEHTYTMY